MCVDKDFASSLRVMFVKSIDLMSLGFFLFRRQQVKDVSILYFFESSPCLVKIVKLFLPRHCSVEQMEFVMEHVRDEQGKNVCLRITYEDLGEFQRQIRGNPVFRKVVDETEEWRYFEYYLAKHANIFRRELYLLQVALWKLREQGISSQEAVFIMNAHPWQKELEAYAAKRGLRVVATERGRYLLRAVGDFIKRSFRSQIHALSFRWSGRRLTPLRREAAEEGRSGKCFLAVDYCGQFNLDQPQCHSDLFFYPYSGIRGEDIQLLFHMGHDPLDELKMEALRRHGIRPVAMNAIAAGREVAEAFFPELPLKQKGNGLGFKPGLGDELWVRGYCAEFSSEVDYWEKYFRYSGAKVYTSCFKYDHQHIAVAEAARHVGAVMTIYQRAWEVRPSPQTSLCADVAFVFSHWGLKCTHDTLQAEYGVVTGYLGDHRAALCQEMAAVIRSELIRNGAEYIIGFLDENTVDDPRWLFGHRVSQEDYAFLFSKVIDCPWLGLVVKPKVPATLRRRLGAVTELMDRALATGRCYIALGGKIHGSYTPVLAALASDLVVHQHSSAMTAALESALAGVPTVLLDREKFGEEIGCDLPGGKIIFSDLKQVWDIFESKFRRGNPIDGLGDWSSVLPEFDPFRDGRAVERLGKFLYWLLEGFREGMSREQILADAAERYARQWGKDKILTMNG